jgi:patatin-like phospholipase
MKQSNTKQPETGEGHSKDYEFSRAAMEEHWRAGYHDARRTLRHREVLERPTNPEGALYFRSCCRRACVGGRKQ